MTRVASVSVRQRYTLRLEYDIGHWPYRHSNIKMVVVLDLLQELKRIWTARFVISRLFNYLEGDLLGDVQYIEFAQSEPMRIERQ